MILLELSFEYDAASRVIGTQSGTSNGFQVYGISTPRVQSSGAAGGMVREFYEHASGTIRTNSLGDFRINLDMAFRVALHGGGIDPELDEWLSRINPYITDSKGGRPIIKSGTNIRFYHPDGPEGSWVWNDTVKEVTAILRP